MEGPELHTEFAHKFKSRIHSPFSIKHGIAAIIPGSADRGKTKRIGTCKKINITLPLKPNQ